MQRAHNFYAGPAILPVEVVEETRDAVMNFQNTGMSIMEISHRSKEFDAVIKEAQSDALKIMGLSEDEYYVIFLGGGASMQFAMLPMNFLHTKADYLNTGEWSRKAIKEAKMFGEVCVVGSSEEQNYTFIPKNCKWSADADYAHITTNNTIFGTRVKNIPDVGSVPLVADMSSDFLSRRLDYSKFNLIYAGAQKNIGPAGVTFVCVKKSWIEEKAKKDIPTMLKYKTHVDKESLFNTPPCLPVFVVHRTFKWILKQGGLEAIEKVNEAKAKLIYDVIDTYPEFYKGTVTDKEDRSIMNITFNLPNADLEAKFVNEAKALNMFGLKGHRSVGGIRASVYNACPTASCQFLANFMEDFYKKNK
jgi:phosphoserine aminotransferase